MTITEKVAYLKGLADGMELDKTTKENKLTLSIIDLLEEIGYAIADLEESTDLLEDALDIVSEDLGDVEDILFGDMDDEDDEDEEDDDCDCGCGCDGDFFELECPNCQEALDVDEKVLEDSKITCAKCGESFAVEFVDCEDDEEETIEDL